MTKWMVLEVNEKERQYRITVAEDPPVPWQHDLDWAVIGGYKKVDECMTALTNYLNMEQSKNA